MTQSSKSLDMLENAQSVMRYYSSWCLRFRSYSVGLNYKNMHCVKYAKIRVFSDPCTLVQSLYGDMRVRGNPFSDIFYAVSRTEHDSSQQNVPDMVHFQSYTSFKAKVTLKEYVKIWIILLKSWNFKQNTQGRVRKCLKFKDLPT